MKKTIILSIITIVCLFLGARAYYALTDDFRLGNIQNESISRPEWEIPAPSSDEKKQIDAILSEKFSYLGKGAQSYVFESQNGLYVIKFFKFKHLRPSLWLELLPPIGPLKAYKDRQQQRKLRKYDGVFSSYKLAYLQDKDLSGLIYVKLNPAKGEFPQIHVNDKMGIERIIDLNAVPFILQKKGITLRQMLKQQLDRQQVDQAIASILQVFELYKNEYRRGLWDHDHGVLQNAGFIQDVPAHLDVGKLYEAPEMRDPEKMKADLKILIDKIDRWMQKNYPQEAQQVYKAMTDYVFSS